MAQLLQKQKHENNFIINKFLQETVPFVIRIVNVRGILLFTRIFFTGMAFFPSRFTVHQFECLHDILRVESCILPSLASLNVDWRETGMKKRSSSSTADFAHTESWRSRSRGAVVKVRRGSSIA